MNKTWIATGMAGMMLLAASQAALAAGQPVIMSKYDPKGPWDCRSYGHVERGMTITHTKPWPPPHAPALPRPPGPPRPLAPPPPPPRPVVRPPVRPSPTMGVTVWAHGTFRDCSQDYDPVIIDTADGRRLYQPRIHGHPAFIQVWSDYHGEWIIVSQHPSIW